MAIVKMKRIRLIALAQDRDALLAGLLHAGCVEVKEPSQTLAEGPDFLRREDARVAQAKDAQGELKAAVTVLNHTAPQKGGLFTPRDQMTEKDFLDKAALDRALALAEEINSHAKAVSACSAREARLEADRLALEPWSAYDAPLELKGTKTTSVLRWRRLPARQWCTCSPQGASNTAWRSCATGAVSRRLWRPCVPMVSALRR